MWLIKKLKELPCGGLKKRKFMKKSGSSIYISVIEKRETSSR